jgi:ubiquinone/menaquinone biosynthesis C-methylase UbiE
METVDYRQFQLTAGDTILDLGCGEGRHVISAYLQDDINAFGVDLSHADLKSTLEKFEPFAQPDNPNRQFALSAANALCLPFADDTFDKVICSEVLEHIPDWEAALAEVERVLKPGGVFCASVPRYWPERVCWALSDEYHANEGGHLRIFKAYELRVAIENLGFRFLQKHWAHALHAPYWWLKCMFWSNQDNNPLVKLYHRLLVWDMMDRPWITTTLEKLLNPLVGKSVVMYFRKEVPA